MPELPEVETVVRGLRPLLLECVVENIKISDKKLRFMDVVKVNELYGYKVKAIERRSKYIIITFYTSHLCLVFHLGMSGNITTYESYLPKKHDHVIIQLSDKTCVYNDPRRFGAFLVLEYAQLAKHKLFCNLGLEPFSHLEEARIQQMLATKKQSLKSWLMDAKNIVGIGNIYACEILFRMGLHPQIPANSLSGNRIIELIDTIKQILQEAINSGGSTLKDYKQADGSQGYFQHNFSVYGRQGKPCNLCNNNIENIKIAGRSTFFCPECQKRDEEMKTT